MKTWFRFACCLLLLPLCAADAPKWESIEWTDIWVPHADRNELPRVLLVGDSIVRGYYNPTEKLIEGKAYCARYTTSGFVGQEEFLVALSVVLESHQYDVIHINNGLHGWAYAEEDYAKSFPKLLQTLKKHAPGATLLWAMTTPVRTSSDLARFDEKTARVKERNRIALEFTQAHEIPVNDLFALVENHADFYAGDGVHFNDSGRDAQGKQVAEFVLQHLAARSAEK